MTLEINFNLLNYEDRDVDNFPEVDPALQKVVTRFFNSLEKDYSISIMDITEEPPVRYAEHRPTSGYQPGSVGKLAVLLGFFTELTNIYGNDWEAKRALLKSKLVWCGKWGIPNSHTVPFYDITKDKLEKRHVKADEIYAVRMVR